MTKAGKIATYAIKKLWLLLAVFLVLFAVMLSVMRYALPHIDHKKYLLEDFLSEKYGVELNIDNVQATWQRSGPSIVLNQVTLKQNDSSPVAMHIDQVYMEIDFWETLSRRMLSSREFTLQGLSMEVDADRMDGTGDSDFPVIDALKSLFLEQLQRFSLNDGEVAIVTDDDREVVQLESLSWINRGNHHQGTGAIRVQELTNNSASFILDLTGTKDNLNGVLYAKAEDLDISPWISGLLQTHRPLQESRANFQVWAQLKDSKLGTLQAVFDESKLVWGANDAHSEAILNTGIRGGSIQAFPMENGWNFRVDQLIFDSNGQSLVTDLVGTFNHHNELLVNTVKPAPINPFLAVLPLLTSDTTDEDLKGLDPKGQLATLQLQWKPKGVEVAAKLLDMSWEQHGRIPGFDNLDADFYWYKNQGVLALSAANAMIFSDNLLPENIVVNEMGGNIYFYPSPNKTQKSWVISTSDFTFDSDKLTLQPAFSYDTGEHSLLLRTDIEQRPLANVQALLPGPLMGQNTTRFLNRAFVGPGTIEGATIIWQGKPADFPFENQEGIFQAKVNVTDSTFKFSDEWPALSSLDLSLLFENASLDINSPSGLLADVNVSNVSARIPRLAPDSKVIVKADGQAQGADVASLMNKSQLAESLGRVLTDEVIVDGPVSATLELNIPFNDDQVVARGSATLQNNSVNITSTKMSLKQTSGDITFINGHIQAKGMSANILGQAVSFDVEGNNNEQDYTVGVKISGTWHVSPLLAQFNPDYNEYLKGQASWGADVDIRLPKEGFEYDARITSALNGVTSRLPLPFKKSADEDMILIAEAHGNSQASTINATLGDDVRFDGVLPHQEMQFSRAHLALGNSDFVGMGIGFSISANVNVVNVSEWYKAIELLLGGLDEGKGSLSKPLFSVPERIFLETDDLVVAGQTLSNVKLTAKQNNNNWTMDINSSEARATVSMYEQWLNRGIEIEADYIHFNEWNETGDALAYDWDADTLPPIYFHCKQCSLLDKDLGEVTLEVARGKQGMDIRQLKAVSEYGKLSASGKWLFDEDINETHFAGSLKSHDVGMMLKNWGAETGIKDSGASLDFDFSWPKSPMDFSDDTLSGKATWSLSDGYLTELSDKGSRIFTLFSLNSLVRKLSLDFRDVFAKGFFYDDMHGSLNFANGNAFTDDTEIDGGAGEITIRGYTNLSAKTLNYDVSFTPNVTGNLPFLVYFLATPQTALAALAIDQVLTSAKVISNVNYKVTGTINEPVFEEVGRNSKEVTLPAQASPVDERDEPLTDQDLQRLKLEIIDG